MGINGLWKFFDDQIETVYIDRLYTKSPNDKIISKPLFMVDANLYLHKYIIGIRNSGKDIINNFGSNINHLHAITKFIRSFTDNMLVPFCIFDGKSPEIKTDTILKRKETREISKEECKKIKVILDNNKYNDKYNDNTELYDEYLKNFKRSVSLTSKMVDECKKYLDICGIPHLTAMNESDPQLVGLSYYYQDIIEGIYSEDSDMFLYGAEKLYKDFDKDNKTFKRLTLTSILNSLQNKTNEICKIYNLESKTITKKIFFDFAKILGTDYNTGIRKFGGNDRNKIFEIFVLSEFNLENFIEKLKDINKINNEYFISDDFLEKSELIDKYYSDVMIINPINFNVKLKEPEINKIKSLLKTNNFRDEIIQNILSSILSFYKIFNNCIRRVNTNINTAQEGEWTVVKNKKHKFHLMY